MALPERRRQSGTPDSFAVMMTDLYAGDVAALGRVQTLGDALEEYNVVGHIDLGGVKQELGFVGPMAEKISEWKKAGLGKEIVIPLKPTYRGEPLKHKSMLYAMPLTDESAVGQDKRVLLIFPTQESFDVKVVGPSLSKDPDAKIQQGENEGLVSDFSLMFLQPGKETVHTSWQPRPEQSVVDSFMNNIHLFPIQIDELVDEGPYELIAKAEELGERMKVDRIRTDSYSLKETLDPTVVVAIEDIESNWDIFFMDKSKTVFDRKDTKDNDTETQ